MREDCPSGDAARRPPQPGRLPLLATAAVLIGSGLFALALGATGRLLPHDEQYLGMSADALCRRHGCRVVHFMAHDRVSFGGALAAVGVLYGWVTAGPLRAGRPWAWWALAASGAVGFGSFLSYLGYGYLDTGHGLATLALLPCFVAGMCRARRMLRRAAGLASASACRPWGPRGSAAWAGQTCLLAAATGLVAGGMTILSVGMTYVFVPQDLAYLGVEVGELYALNPRLVPLIAHDRAGFGGAVCSAGLVLLFCVRHGDPSRGLWAALAVAGAVGFSPAIGVHPAIGYTDPVHLAPAAAGAGMYLTGLGLTFRRMMGGGTYDCRRATGPAVPGPGRRPRQTGEADRRRAPETAPRTGCFRVNHKAGTAGPTGEGGQVERGPGHWRQAIRHWPGGPCS